ncbi:MAG: hypothetical protein ACYTG5_16240 [Planctomycetota bacterium]
MPVRREQPVFENSDLVGQFEEAFRVKKSDLDSIENPIERMTARFVRDLIGEDRRRVQRELGTPILTRRMRRLDNNMLHVRFRELEEEQEAIYMQEEGRSLLRRPLRKILKNFTLVADIDAMIKEFKAENIPTSGDYQSGKRKSSGWGRVSMRVKVRRLEDPLELSYRNWGWKVASNLERAKLKYEWDLTDKIEAELGWRYSYDDHSVLFRAGMHYIIDPKTSMSVILGDQLNYLGGTSTYSYLRSPMDGDDGILFNVRHRF